MDAARLEPGTVLAGKYRLDQPLGVGGMGTVYLAEHLMLKAPVAVKVVDGDPADGEIAVARFMREAQAAASLRSPHVVQILDYGTEGNLPFIVMELLEGETLAERLARVHRLGPPEAFKVLSHVARAIGKAHEAGIIHRDLKPDNVFLVHNEGDEIAKVLDFGVAKFDDQAITGTRTRTGSLLGTPYYMSPEQAQGNKEIDYRSDLWALGVIAFECLTGKRPFSSDGLGDLVIQICIRDIPVPSSLAAVPENFDAWFLKAVARDPEERFQSARALIDALADALGIVREMAPSAPDTGFEPGEMSRRFPKRTPAPNAVAVPDEPEPSRPFHERTPAWGPAWNEAPASGRASSTLPNPSTGGAASAPNSPPLGGGAPGPSPLTPAMPSVAPGRPSEWRNGPLMPRHAVADTLPAPAPFAKTGLILGLTSMLLGAIVVFGMKQVGVLPNEVSAWLEGSKAPPAKKTAKGASNKKPTSTASAAKAESTKKASPAASPAPKASNPSKPAGLPPLSPKIVKANRPEEPEVSAPTPTQPLTPEPKRPQTPGEPSEPVAPSDSKLEPEEPAPVVPPELAPPENPTSVDGAK